MTTLRYQIVCRRIWGCPTPGSLLTIERLARFTATHPDLIRRFLEWGLVTPVTEEPELLFRDTAVPRVRRIMRLRGDLGVNLAGAGVVLELQDRIEALEKEIDKLRGRS